MKSIKAVCLAFASVLSSASFAGTPQSYYPTPTGMFHTAGNYIDLKSVPQHGDYPTVTSPAISASIGAKYLPIEITGTGGCYWIRTFPETYSNVDTRFWYKRKSSTTWLNLHDDIAPGTNYRSEAFFWVNQNYSDPLQIAVGVYSPSYNFMDFNYTVAQSLGAADNGSPSACNTAAGALPFLQYVGGVVTPFRTN